MENLPTGPTQVKVKSCVVKTEKDTFTVYTIILEEPKELSGRAVESFDKFTDGESAQVTFEQNQYGIKIKRVKPPKQGGGFAPKDYTFEKRRVALEQAVATAAQSATQSKSTDIIKVADVYFNWLNQKSS